MFYSYYLWINLTRLTCVILERFHTVSTTTCSASPEAPFYKTKPMFVQVMHVHMSVRNCECRDEIVLINNESAHMHLMLQ